MPKTSVARMPIPPLWREPPLGPPRRPYEKMIFRWVFSREFMTISMEVMMILWDFMRQKWKTSMVMTLMSQVAIENCPFN